MSQSVPDKLLSGCASERQDRKPRHYWLWCCSLGFGCVVIVAIFFHGCERRRIIRPTPQMDAESRFWIRVLLATDATECTVAAPAVAHVLQPGIGSPIPVAGAPLSLQSPTTVRLSGGQFLVGTATLPGDGIVISPQRPHVFELNGVKYRGKLQLVSDAQRRTFDAINMVPLEAYLAGVVGAEMPDYWEPQALRAQAIAARTYCLYIKNRFGLNRTWDVSRTQASQVYNGVDAESSPVWDAVISTSGRVLTTGEHRRGSDAGASMLDRGLFPTYYCAVCGGHTADSEKVFGDSFGPLRGVACPYCKDVAKLGLFFWPMAQFDRQTVTQQLAQRYPTLRSLGEIAEITVTEKSDYGQFSRLTRIKLVGATGKTDTLRGEDLRLALDPTGRKIKSTICHVVPWGNGWAFLSGRGWGHGVGMCQCGAQGLARLGKSDEEILQYYYPGAVVVGLY